MAKTAHINIRVEPQMKEEIERLFSHFGITVSDAVNIFFHKSLMEGGLPFSVTCKGYNEETRQALEEAKEGKGLSKAYTDLDEMWRDLNA